MEEQLERIVLRIPEVFVYQIPPRESTGHVAERWKESIWKGRLHVIGRGDICIIRLLELDSETLFAYCIVSKDIERAVERTIDSSRYFVLRLDDSKGHRHAFVGIGFSNRSNAFDFICAVNDFHQIQLPVEPVSVDQFPLEKGAQVKIHLKNIPTKSRRSKLLEESPSSVVIPPPPSSTRRCNKQDNKLVKETNKSKNHRMELLTDAEFSSSFLSIEEKKKETESLPEPAVDDVWSAFSEDALKGWELPTESSKNPFADDCAVQTPTPIAECGEVDLFNEPLFYANGQ